MERLTVIILICLLAGLSECEETGDQNEINQNLITELSYEDTKAENNNDVSADPGSETTAPTIRTSHDAPKNGQNWDPTNLMWKPPPKQSERYFTAPVQGVYYFTFSSFRWGRKTGTSGGSLYHNGNQIVSWYGHSQAHPISASNSAVLMLQVRDKVNVRLWENQQISDNENKYCTFTGFLLFPM
ncbi:complement C1q-like protein 2 [Haplochromis burtoni]|uniref:complement C1q-like protein 2 n=1 Tax=Haplochromis burtoni TaxID=8153 RepID=UPI001C2D35A4|nr:complement C1q-like protein 2 [Haplochromis burtoni]